MPELHLKHPDLTNSACGPFIKNKERIQKFRQTGNTNHIFKNDLEKACFQHDLPHGKYKNLTEITQSHNVLREKSFEIVSNSKHDDFLRG